MLRTRGKAIALVIAVAAAALPVVTAGSPASAAVGTVTARGSIQQVQVLRAPQNATALLQLNGTTVQRGTTDSLGGFLFHNVKAGPGYSVVVRPGPNELRSANVRVRAANEVPPQTLYSGQHLVTDNLTATSGYGYLKTRDGTTLSVQVVLPGPAADGPYPAVVEYSGYDPSSPTTGQPQYQILAPQAGFAWVGVNIRGTGCSGGAFNFFENLQSLDGYDAIETVAAQPWSTGRVGMVGISYAGISQLFTARSRPPHLAAITPVSVIDDTWRGTLYPGGIFNDGFALSWATERVEQNKWPNPNAPGWVMQRINNGDTTCLRNMDLRGQNADQLGEIERHPFFSGLDKKYRYDFPGGASSLAPAEFVKRIKAPVLIAGAWQDEQTGGHWANLLDKFAPGTFVRAIGQNGVHVESLDPAVISETLDFLQLYVAQRAPVTPPSVQLLAPAILGAITGVSGLALPPDRFPAGTTYAAAKAAYEADPPVRILWETGNAPGNLPGSIPGAPLNRAETRYASWPIPGTTPTTWYLKAGGRLGPARPNPTKGADSYLPNPAARPRGDLPNGNVWAAAPPYQWAPVVAGASLAYLSDPLPSPLTMAGTGSVDLWVSSTAVDDDVQVTLSEVRPDGTERYIQNGWLRLSHRKVDSTRSTTLNPFHSDLETDAAPMPPGVAVPARVALFPFAHQFRAGTRIRLTIQAPGGDRPEWTFEARNPSSPVTNRIFRTPDHASKVVLPVIPNGPDLGPDPAPCPSLRAQPCRPYPAP